MPELLIVRGWPGAGKTTFAQAYVDEFSYAHFEADMYMARSGTYQFKCEDLAPAHAWCQAQTDNAMMHGLNVVVSNTFLTLGEMNVYLAMARRHGYTVKIKTLHGRYGSVHGVPVEKQRQMESRLQELNQQWLLSHNAMEA